MLFNNLCYSVATSFVYDIEQGEQLCANKYSNSTLVKFNFHDWANVNTTRYVLVEHSMISYLKFFIIKSKKKFSLKQKIRKHWLRLLIADRNNSNECVLRYFNRSLGAFTFLHRCADGGHPVCQSQPIPMPSAAEIGPSSTTDKSLTISPNPNTPLSISNDTIADEDLINNETIIDFISNLNNISTPVGAKKSNRYYGFLFIILVGLILAFSIFSIALILLIRYCRRSHGSYSTQNRGFRPLRRAQNSSATSTSNDTSSNTPAVLYSRLKSTPPTITIETDMADPFDDNVQLIPPVQKQTNVHENMILEENEEPLYATLKLPSEK